MRYRRGPGRSSPASISRIAAWISSAVASSRSDAGLLEVIGPVEQVAHRGASASSTPEFRPPAIEVALEYEQFVVLGQHRVVVHRVHDQVRLAQRAGQ